MAKVKKATLTATALLGANYVGKRPEIKLLLIALIQDKV
jgi:hypothetical protein